MLPEHEIFRSFIEKYVVEMIPGTSLSKLNTNLISSDYTVAKQSAYDLKLYCNESGKEYYTIHKNSPFSDK